MQAGKAVRTVVAVLGTGGLGGHQPSTYFTGKAVVTRVRFIISLLFLDSFLFAIHKLLRKVCFFTSFREVYNQRCTPYTGGLMPAAFNAGWH